MPAPVPGTVVSSGSAVGPGGDTGLAGALTGEDVGSIKAWPSVTPPGGWMLMDHSAISRTLYPQLFALIGTSFGAGDGSTTFNLPDMRGRFILNLGQSNAPGNTLHNLGDASGEETHALVTGELATHNHTATQGTHTHSDNGHQHQYNTVAVAGGSQFASGSGYTVTGPSATSGVGYASLAAASAGAITIANAGSGTAHNTLPPFLCLVYIIKVSPTGGPTAQAPIADATQAGLMNRLSGSAGDYVGGDNACHVLPASQPARFISLNSAYTLTSADSGKYVIATPGAIGTSWTLTLPTPAVGLTYSVRNDIGYIGQVGNSAGSILLQPVGGSLIDGLASLSLLASQECTLFSDGTNWRTRGLSRVVVIGTIDISSAVANQTILLPVGYRLFEIDLYGFAPVTANVAMRMQFSADGGNTFLATTYYDATLYNTAATTAGYSYAANATNGRLSSAVRNNASDSSQIQIRLNPGATKIPTWLARATGFDGANSWVAEWNIVGMLYTVGQINAMQVNYSSGNIAAGSIILRGIV